MEIIAPKVGRAVTYGFTSYVSKIPLHFVRPGQTDGFGNKLVETPETQAKWYLKEFKKWAANRDTDEVYYDPTEMRWYVIQKRTLVHITKVEGEENGPIS